MRDSEKKAETGSPRSAPNPDPKAIDSESLERENLGHALTHLASFARVNRETYEIN